MVTVATSSETRPQFRKRRSDRGLIPVVAVEEAADLATLTERSQQLGQDRAMCRKVVGSYMLS